MKFDGVWFDPRQALKEFASSTSSLSGSPEPPQKIRLEIRNVAHRSGCRYFVIAGLLMLLIQETSGTFCSPLKQTLL